MLSAVRSATDPLSHGIQNTQPFSYGALSFLHNGYVLPFRGALSRKLREGLGETAHAALRGDTDSEHLFALVIDEWLKTSELAPAHRLRASLEGASAKLRALCEEHGARSLVSAVLSDGTRIACSRWSFGEGEQKAPSLYRLVTESALIVASEPLDAASSYERIEEGEVAVFEQRSERIVREG
jgi:glutamine amidotransferase